MTDVQVIDTKELAKCPYCDKDLDRIEKVTIGTLARAFIFKCPYCKKLLSVFGA